jgi:hypothetical protein
MLIAARVYIRLMFEDFLPRPRARRGTPIAVGTRAATPSRSKPWC